MFSMLLSILIILLSILLDQWTKYLAVVHLSPIDTMPLIPDILHLTYLENRGAAFGMLADKRWVFMILSTVSIVLILVWLFREKPASLWVNVAVSMIVGGGIGNMIDRVKLGYVVDFIDVRAIDFYVFNGADSFVCVGCGMVVVWVLYMELVKKQPAMDMLFGSDKKKADTAQADTTVPEPAANATDTIPSEDETHGHTTE